MKRLQGKVALISGASGGLGAAMVKRFVSEGATVMATGRSQTTLMKLGLGANVSTAVCDITVEEDVHRLHEECFKRFGRLDILCANAGVSAAKTKLHETDISQFDELLKVNLRGTFLMLRETLQLMSKGGNGGSIIMMSSVAGVRGVAGSASYCASKFGLMGLMRAAALDYASQQIRVNAICPGLVQTDLVERGDPRLIAEMKEAIPLQRIGSADEVAALAAFLASDEANYITGSTYLMDGGRCAA